MSWFCLTASNSQSQYGYGCEHDASEYCDFLNRDREINHYWPVAMSDAEALAEGLEGPNAGNLGFSFADALADAAA